MTRIADIFAFTPVGNPVGPVAPPTLRVLGGQQATAQQMQYAQQAYYRFQERARLSVVPNPIEAGRLPDGTQYRIVTIAPHTIMEIWPVGGQPIDSKSAIYVELLPPGAQRSMRYLLRPKGTVAVPGRPWSVEVIPTEAPIYDYVENDPPWPNSQRYYVQGTDVSWHSAEGKNKKNYLVIRGDEVSRQGAQVATLLVGGSKNNTPREFSDGGVKFFGNVLLNPAEIRFVTYDAKEFAYRETPVKNPPLLVPISDQTIFTATNNTAILEYIVGVSEHPNGGKLYVLLDRISNPTQTRSKDQWGRHERSGCVYRDVFWDGYYYRMAISLGVRLVADPEYQLVVDEYQRQGSSWSKTASVGAKVAGNCTPSRFRVSEGQNPTFADMLKVHENVGLPPINEVRTSGPLWGQVKFDQQGTAKYSASSSANYDQLVEVKRFTRNGGLSQVESWGGESYSVTFELSSTFDKLIYQEWYETGGGLYREYTNADRITDVNESRIVEEGLLLGNRRLTTFKTSVSVLASSTRTYRSDYQESTGSEPTDWIANDDYAGTVTLAWNHEGRNVIAYDPFLDLLCYTECLFNYNATFSASRKIILDLALQSTRSDTTIGSDCFLPITGPANIDLVIECRGQTIRIPVPKRTEQDGSTADELYIEKALQIPNFGGAANFEPPGYRPAILGPDAAYKKQAQIAVSGGFFSAHTNFNDFNSKVFGFPSGSTATFNRNRLCFGAMLNPANALSARYATDPRTGGAVIAFELRGKIPFAFAVDINGVRPLTDILPGTNPEHITTIGSA
jgi:hypothetical protein